MTWKNELGKKMELTRELTACQHFLQQECIDEPKALFGNKASSYGTVKNWFNELNCGPHSLKDAFREVCPAVVSSSMTACEFSVLHA